MKTSTLLSFFVGLVLLAACSGTEMVPLPEPSAVPSATPLEASPTSSTLQTQEATESMAPTTGSSQAPSAQNLPPQPYAPQPGDAGLKRSPVYLDSAEIATLESFPPQFRVMLSGNLPTPCNKLRVSVTGPDQNNRIELGVYSVISTQEICAQVLSPFEAAVPLGTFAKGKYTVLLDGKPLGEFIVP